MSAPWNILWECHLAFFQSFFLPNSHWILLKAENRTVSLLGFRFFKVPQACWTMLRLFQPGLMAPHDLATAHLSYSLSYPPVSSLVALSFQTSGPLHILLPLLEGLSCNPLCLVTSCSCVKTQPRRHFGEVFLDLVTILTRPS